MKARHSGEGDGGEGEGGGGEGDGGGGLGGGIGGKRGEGGGSEGGIMSRGPQSVQSVPYAQVSPVTFTSPTAPSWQCVLLSYGPPRPPE